LSVGTTFRDQRRSESVKQELQISINTDRISVYINMWKEISVRKTLDLIQKRFLDND
jgi:hypothetical protein